MPGHKTRRKIELTEILFKSDTSRTLIFIDGVSSHII